MHEVVRYQTDAGVASITMTEAEPGNVLTTELLEGLKTSVLRANADEMCRVIVLSAEGGQFSQGMDLAAFAHGGVPELAYFQLFAECLKLICRSSRPMIACVDGNVAGGGVGLIAACDIVLSSKKSLFMLSEVVLGMIPALVTPFLQRRLTLGRIRYMTLSSRGVDADEAKEFGLVDEVTSGELDDTCKRHIQRLLRSSPAALAAAKQYLERIDHVNLDRDVEIALEQVSGWLKRPEVLEGIRTFSDGFAPSWFQRQRTPKNG